MPPGAETVLSPCAGHVVIHRSAPLNFVSGAGVRPQEPRLQPASGRWLWCESQRDDHEGKEDCYLSDHDHAEQIGDRYLRQGLCHHASLRPRGYRVFGSDVGGTTIILLTLYI